MGPQDSVGAEPARTEPPGMWALQWTVFLQLNHSCRLSLHDSSRSSACFSPRHLSYRRYGNVPFLLSQHDNCVSGGENVMTARDTDWQGLGLHSSSPEERRKVNEESGPTENPKQSREKEEGTVDADDMHPMVVAVPLLNV
uniref:Uncharacterized protein n=1 Tax=Knipowitschia caucasica TaxID=637954 RepID=A0AAV2IZQ3_KNICA